MSSLPVCTVYHSAGVVRFFTTTSKKLWKANRVHSHTHRRHHDARRAHGAHPQQRVRLCGGAGGVQRGHRGAAHALVVKGDIHSAK